LNVADAGSRRLRRVNFIGLVQPIQMQETEVFCEGEGVKASRMQVMVTIQLRGMLFESSLLPRTLWMKAFSGTV